MLEVPGKCDWTEAKAQTQMPAALLSDDGEVMACAFVSRAQRARMSVPTEDCLD